MTSAQPRLSRVSAAIALSFALAAAPALAAGFLKLGDVKGESKGGRHTNQVEVLSWSWGETQAIGSWSKAEGLAVNWKDGTAAGGGGGAGKSAVQDISATGKQPAQAGEKPFVADSFSFGVEREMKESGEKGGTADINIGVGELQEMTISKSTEMASTKLLQPAIKGKVFASPPPGRGSLTTTVPSGTCRLGARYPTAEFGDGRRVYVMKNVIVANCKAVASNPVPMEQISLNYEEIK